MFMNLNVLIIEDQSIIALHIKEAILSLGHNVISIVKNHKSALSISSKHKIDLVISDINLVEGIHGIECCYDLQKLYDVFVIFLTDHNDTKTLEKIIDIKIEGYLLKPFREEELKTLINLIAIKSKTVNTNDLYKICDDYSYCYNENKLFYKNTEVILTKKESIFLRLLLNSKSNLVSYNTIDHHIWDGNIVDDATRRQLFYRFRKKTPLFPLSLIKGQGYKLI